MITLYNKNKAYTVAQAQPSVQSYYGLKILIIIIISDNNILHLVERHCHLPNVVCDRLGPHCSTTQTYYALCRTTE